MHTLVLCKKSHIQFKVHVDLSIVADSVKLFLVVLGLFITIIFIFWTYIQLKPCFFVLKLKEKKLISFMYVKKEKQT